MKRVHIINLNDNDYMRMISFLLECDNEIYPPLSSRVCLKEYAKKLLNRAIVYAATSGEQLLGLIAFYVIETKGGIDLYISLIIVSQKNRGEGIGARLLERAFYRFNRLKHGKILLEVHRENWTALKFYYGHGFKKTEKISLIPFDGHVILTKLM